jgi:hypothetical protein
MKARDNLFRSERVESLSYRFQDGDWAGLMKRLEALSYRAAIVGPHGAGKTTLLNQLAPRLAEAGFRIKHLFLNDQSHPIDRATLRAWCDGLSRETVVLLDGADLMSRMAWWRFRRASQRAAGLIVTSHRAGLLPTLIECRTTPELLDELLAELLGEPRQNMQHAERFDKHRGNLRDVLRELYDIYAQNPDGTL